MVVPNEVRARLVLSKLPAGLVSTARIARADYWASIGNPDRVQQEPSEVSLLAWCRVVTRIQYSAVMAAADVIETPDGSGERELRKLASGMPGLIDRIDHRDFPVTRREN